MDEHQEILQEGITEFVDEKGNTVLKVQLTSLSLIVFDTDGKTPIINIPRLALKWLDHMQKRG